MRANGCAMLVLACGALALAAPGCANSTGGGDVAGDGGDTDHGGGEGSDGAESGDWGPECLVDTDCDDGVDCTVDVCDRGLCRNTPDDLPCQDDLVCNGHEVCDPHDGCVPGEPFRGCNDGNACTMDRCVEPEPGMAPSCLYLPLDRDSDTYVDVVCGGTDCNDLDPNSYPGALENCFDTFDNNCDGLTDSADTACQMNFDNCSSPRELIPGTDWEGFTNGATADVAASCDISSYADVVFSFTVTETSDALISVSAPSSYAYVALQRTCGDPTSELRCTSSSLVSIYQRALEPGIYYVVVSGWDNPAVSGDEMTFNIRLDLTPSTTPAAGDTCDNPIDLTLPAHEEGNLTRMGDDITLPCASWMDAADTVYSFTLPEPQDVTIAVASARLSPYVGLLSTCDGTGGTTLVCGSGWPFHRTIGNVPAGTYYLWVEASGAGTYSVDVSASTPTPPPANDTCPGAIDISAGGTFEGTLLSSTDDYMTSCSGAGRDVAYVLNLTEPQQVSLVLQAHYDLYPYLELTTECGNLAAETLCQWYEYPTALAWRSLGPGTYYILVKANAEGTFALTATVADPAPGPCEDLPVIAASGTYDGTTLGAFDDSQGTCGSTGGQDVTYEVDVPTDGHLTAEILANPSGDWDSVMYLRTVCDDPASQITCSDDYGGTVRPKLDSIPVTAGTYYLTVDGFSSYSSGAYSLSVTLGP